MRFSIYTEISLLTNPSVISFIAYWMSDAFNAATWEFASSIIAIGLTWKESVSIVAISFFIVSIVIALNGATGVIHHASFPVLARASWGFWGSYIAIVSRVILAIFWFAIQTMNGANTVRVMLGAIWPSFLTLKNTIPENQGITTNTMISFVLFWLAQVPFLYMHPNNLRWLFMAKSIIVPIAFIAILIWAFRSSGGGTIFEQQATIHGSAYSWAYLASMTSVIGNYATLSVNQVSFCKKSIQMIRISLITYRPRPTSRATPKSASNGKFYTCPCCLFSSPLSPSSGLQPHPPGKRSTASYNGTFCRNPS